MIKYLKFVVYYTLGLLDATINFIGSLFHVYPCMDLAGEFLLKQELGRVYNEIDDREKLREEREQEADKMMEQAKSDWNQRENN